MSTEKFTFPLYGSNTSFFGGVRTETPIVFYRDHSHQHNGRYVLNIAHVGTGGYNLVENGASGGLRGGFGGGTGGDVSFGSDAIPGSGGGGHAAILADGSPNVLAGGGGGAGGGTNAGEAIVMGGAGGSASAFNNADMRAGEDGKFFGDIQKQVVVIVGLTLAWVISLVALMGSVGVVSITTRLTLASMAQAGKAVRQARWRRSSSPFTATIPMTKTKLKI